MFDKNDSLWIDCEGVTCQVDGFTVRATVECDADMREPWREHDGHGIVSDWTYRDKRPGERVLVCDRLARRYYDIEASTKKAREECWGCAGGQQEGETVRQYRARAVQEDFERLQAWCHDEWYWVSVVLAVEKSGIVLDNCAASLGGIESDAGGYLIEVANELLPEAVRVGKGLIEMLCSGWEGGAA